MLHLFQRWGDKVTMANMAQMVNVIAPIFTSPQGLFLQPNFFPMELYRAESGDRVLHSWQELRTADRNCLIRFGKSDRKLLERFAHQDLGGRRAFLRRENRCLEIAATGKGKPGRWPPGRGQKDCQDQTGRPSAGA
jgi:hypothetical protein